MTDDLIPQLIQLLREMDRQQQQTDHDGGREIAWYYWRDEIEDHLGLTRGALDTPPPDDTHAGETAEQTMLRELHTRVVADEAVARALALLHHRLGHDITALNCDYAVIDLERAATHLGNAHRLTPGQKEPL